jgi:hypothetical protein
MFSIPSPDDATYVPATLYAGTSAPAPLHATRGRAKALRIREGAFMDST